MPYRYGKLTSWTQLKRSHSTDPDKSTPEASQEASAAASSTSQETPNAQAIKTFLANSAGFDTSSEAMVGSPLKKQRPSMDHSAAGVNISTTQSLSAALDSAISSGSAIASGSGSEVKPAAEAPKAKIEEEEL